MDYLPLFADIRQRPVLVVGGGEVAARKVALLKKAGAILSLIHISEPTRLDVIS
ncbi:NAD(P)-dependent oxidoreductase, partial [Zymomonas mobilis]|uniref:NAD(P)-dependent oxidoreductase n=1 Tax=Zymomonas mobilis TaxID=542 RepID=UPI0024301A21